MIFCVPSYGRAGKVSDFVIYELRKHGDVILYVREKERKAYRDAYPQKSITVCGVPNTANTIAKTRAFMCKDIDTAVWAMVDDDISGFCAKANTEKFGGVAKADPRTVRKYLREISDELLYLCTPDKIGVIGIPDRMTLARPHGSYSSALPVRQFIFLTRAAAKAARYTMPLLSDIDCCLHWASQKGSVIKNHPNLGQSSPPTAKLAAKGGCGEYREKNPEYYLNGYIELAKRWPSIVRIGIDSDGAHTKRIAWSKVR